MGGTIRGWLWFVFGATSCPVSGVVGVGALDSARAESCRFRLGDFGVGRFAVSGSWCGLAVGGERQLFSKRALFSCFTVLL